MSRLNALYEELQQNQAALKDIRAERDKTTGQFPPDVREKIEKINARFTELKGEIATEERLEAMEKDALLMEARSRTTSATPPPVFGNQTTTAPALTHERAFNRWLTQHPDAPDLSPEEARMLNAHRVEQRGTNTQVSDVAGRGGYLVPESFSNQLEEMMKFYGDILTAAGVYNDNIGGTLRWPTGDDTAETGNIRTPQGTASAVQDMTFGRVLFGDWTVDSGIVKVSEEFMQDERVGFLTSILLERLSNRIGRKLNSILTNGTGTNEPYGLTTTVTNSTITTASGTAITKAELIKAQHKIDKAYRTNAKSGWMMHDTIVGYLRTLDVGNTDTVQIFYPGLAAGEPDRLLGLPIYVNNDLEAAHATTGLPVTAKKHIYLGDFSKFVVRRIKNIAMSRNDMLYWATREVGFMGWMRVDSNLINANAIKYILQA